MFEGVAILTTKLDRDSLAEDANKIIVQLTTGILAPRVQKGILFPHVMEKEEKVITETNVKVFEQSALTNYFYDFMKLKRPVIPQERANETYQQMSKGSSAPLEKLVRAVGQEVAKIAHARIVIDGFDISVSLDELNKKLKVGKIGNKYYVLIEGTNLRAKVGEVDAIKKEGLPILTKQELINYLAKA